MKLAHRKTFAEIRKIKFPTSTFDKSHSHAGSYDWGYLYPICYEEVSPTDSWKIAQQMVAKMMPTIAPLQHEINVFVHYYFVPYRILDENFEDIITGGEDGEDDTAIPIWDPDAADKTQGSLWDHFAYPLTDCTGVEPIDYPKRAYNMIWNEYYRDENLDAEIDINTAHTIQKRAWEKDYFTVSLPWQQRGIAPALPISGIVHALYSAANFPGSGGPAANVAINSAADQLHSPSAAHAAHLLNVFNANNVDLSGASTFDVADLRAAFQMQRWMERNARGGARYTEVLEQHFDDAPRDDRLQRPEYIGGWRQQITVTEVLQTSATVTGQTAQGNRSGIGSTFGGGYVGEYYAQEYGVILGIMSIMPRTMYTQGVNRQWLRRTRYDFLFPEFANLAEQAVLKAELYADANSAENLTTFGFQGQYDELRQTTSRAVGLMRQASGGLIHWNLSRLFSSAPALNSDFIHVETQALKDRVFAVPSQPGFIITFGNIITVRRALPMIAQPGLIDHV